MIEAALFYLDWLVPDDKWPYLVTNPSTSPENKFVTDAGVPCAVTKASTLDLLLIRELFTYCIAASEILNQDAELRMELLDTLSKLYPPQWREGSVRGLRVRSGFTVNMSWNNGKLSEASIFMNLAFQCVRMYF
jgi:hypothetical protein